MPKCRSLVVILLIAGLAVAALPPLALAKDQFTLAISIYAGWMPWYYAKDHGILKKWAERSKIAIDVVEMDYIPSVEAFVAVLAKAVDVPVEMWDESYTTLAAAERLDRRSRSKVDLDAAAAAVILEEYLHHLENVEARKLESRGRNAV